MGYLNGVSVIHMLGVYYGYVDFVVPGNFVISAISCQSYSLLRNLNFKFALKKLCFFVALYLMQ